MFNNCGSQPNKDARDSSGGVVPGETAFLGISHDLPRFVRRRSEKTTMPQN